MIREMRIIMFAVICLLPLLIINAIEPFVIKLGLALMYEMVLMALFFCSSKYEK